MRFALLIAGCLTFLYSCKKNALEGQYETFEGHWKWNYSEEVVFDAFVETFDTIVSHANQASNEYSIEFLRKGKTQLFINDGRRKKFRIVFHDFLSNNSNGLTSDGNYFVIHENGDPNKSMSGYINQDTLLLINYDFPQENYFQNGVQHSFRHYFIRQ